MELLNILSVLSLLKKFNFLLFFFCISCTAQGEKPEQINQDSLRIAESFKKDRPKFDLIDIQIGNLKIKAEYANSPAKRQIGLMYVEKMPKDQGMLFHFDREQMMSFWMKNTLIPLDIAYFSKEGILLEIHELDPPPSLLSSKIPRAESKSLALYALEMNKGWFQRKGLKPGVQLKVLKK